AGALFERRALHERPATLLAADVSELSQITQRVADRDLAHLEAVDQLVLSWQTFPRTPPPRLDVAEQGRLELVVERHRGVALEHSHVDPNHYNDMLSRHDTLENPPVVHRV